MTPETRARTIGYEDAMAWVMVWIKMERDRLHSLSIHPRHVRKRQYVEGKLTTLRTIEMRVEAAMKEARSALEAK